ncbi:MAG: two-component regulator propeller domain-containing protein [Armatimonadota bacterium]
MSASNTTNVNTVPALGYPVPVQEGDGMWSAMGVGSDGSIYMVVSSMCLNPCRLVRLTPWNGQVEVVGVIQEICGETDPELVPQTKVHTQLIEDSRGRIWFGTDSDELYPADAHDWSAATGKYLKGYTGGHLICYDPTTGQCQNHGVLFPKQQEYPQDITECGLYYMTITKDPKRDVLYFMTGNKIFLGAYDMAAERLIDSQQLPIPYPFAPDPARDGCTGFYHCRDMKVGADGWLYTFTREGQVVRYSDLEQRIELTGVWIPGVDRVGPNMPYALAANREGTRIYGSASVTGRLFELVVEPGRALEINDLGDPCVPEQQGLRVIHAITVGLDGMIYFVAASGPWFYRYDPVERRITPYGQVTLTNLDGRSPLGAMGAVTAPDGTLWFAGWFETGQSLFVAITSGFSDQG